MPIFESKSLDLAGRVAKRAKLGRQFSQQLLEALRLRDVGARPSAVVSGIAKAIRDFVDQLLNANWRCVRDNGTASESSANDVRRSHSRAWRSGTRPDRHRVVDAFEIQQRSDLGKSLRNHA